MKLQAIKEAIEEGKNVHWSNSLYQVIKTKNDTYIIYCKSNGYCIELTHKDNLTLNGKQDDFYILDNE